MTGTRCRTRVSGLVAISVLTVLGVTASPDPTGAGSPCGTPGTVDIVNGGFEDPTIEEGRGLNTPPPGWAGSGEVVHWGPAPEYGSQYIEMFGGSVSQQLDGIELAGSTVSLQITWFGVGSVGLGAATQSIDSNDAVATDTVTFDVPGDAAAALPLTITGARRGIFVNEISGTSVTECPATTAGAALALSARSHQLRSRTGTR
jgi:hypothetical protein